MTKKASTSPERAVRRPKQARSRATVEAIIEGATRILASRGWDQMNTNTVADSAGVSVGSVYEYFKDKHAILDVIVDRHLESGEALLAASRETDHTQTSPEKVVAVLVAAFVSLHEDNPPLHRVLATDAPLTKAQRQRVDALRGNTIGLVQSLLEGKVDSPAVKATMLVDCADALAHRWHVDEVGTPVSAQAMSEEMTKMLSLYVVS